MLFCPNPELCQQKTRVVIQRLLTTERCPLFKHPSRGLLVKQGVHLTAGSLGTTWLWSHRPTRRQSDDVRLGHNGLSGLRHMEKVGHKVWSRFVFVKSKVDFRRAAASIYICHQFYGYRSANKVKKRFLKYICYRKRIRFRRFFRFFSLRLYLFIFFGGGWLRFASARPRCLSFIQQRRGRNEAACPCPTQCRGMRRTDKTWDIWLQSRERSAKGSWDAHHISVQPQQNSPNAPFWCTQLTGRRQQPRRRADQSW